jgi:hypothetical protein
MAEPQNYEEEIERARKERDEVTKINPDKRRELVQEQIADALIGIKWAIRSGANLKARRKRTTRTSGAEAPANLRTEVFGTEEAFKKKYPAGPPDDVQPIITGVPRAGRDDL